MSRPDSDALPTQKVASHLGVMLLVAAVLGVVVSGLAIPFAGVIGLSARHLASGAEDLPAELETDLLAQRTILEDRAGNTIATIYDQNRIIIPLHQISPRMIEAILAIEDYRFFQHGALDLKGTLRAFITNQAAGETTQGGSSITQQLVKLTLIEQAEGDAELIAKAQDDTYARKLNELRYAIALEKKYSKQWILERYLNTAYFGDGAYGVQAAAKHYFNVDAKDLTLRQASLLAGLVQSPEAYNPTSNKQAAKERRNVVIMRMAELGVIPFARAEKSSKRGLGLDVQEQRNGCDDSVATWYCTYVLEYLKRDPALGETRADRRRLIWRGGLRITTTIDTRMQRAADASVRKHVYPQDSAVGAIALVEPGSGDVKALAQSRPQGKGPGQTYLNYTVPKKYGDARGFSPGSTFKAFVLAAAIKQGIPLTREFSSASPAHVELDEFTTCDGPYRSSETWEPKNSTSASATPDLYEGTQKSVNTFFVRLEMATGICEPWKLARKMGIKSLKKSDQIPSFTLGVADASPLDMAGAYATFAARGVHCAPRPVAKISDANGNVLKTYDEDCRRVLEQAEADAVNDVLNGVVAPGGFGAALMPGVPAAGKTGTAQNNIAVWFAGYTTDLAGASVIAGQDAEGDPISTDYMTIGGYNRGVTSGSGDAGPIWGDTFKAVAHLLGGEDFVEPDEDMINGVPGVVPSVSGMTISAATDELKDAGFAVRVGSDRNSNVSAGLVAYSSPGGGAQFGQGNLVWIYPSTGYVPPPPKKNDDNKKKKKKKKKGDRNGDGNNGNGNGGRGGGRGGGDDD